MTIWMRRAFSLWRALGAFLNYLAYLSKVRQETLPWAGSSGPILCYAENTSTKITRGGQIMNIFRQLRWKLTLSYTLVTVSAFLVVLLIIGGLFFTQIFIPNNIFNPAQLVETVRQNSSPLWSH